MLEVNSKEKVAEKGVNSLGSIYVDSFSAIYDLTGPADRVLHRAALRTKGSSLWAKGRDIRIVRIPSFGYHFHCSLHKSRGVQVCK